LDLSSSDERKKREYVLPDLIKEQRQAAAPKPFLPEPADDNILNKKALR